MSFLDVFQDLKTIPVVFESQSTTINAGGQPVTTWTPKAAIYVGKWKNGTALGSDGKLIGLSNGQIFVDPRDINYTIDESFRFTTAGETYYVKGVDDIGGTGEVIIVDWDKREDQL